MRKTVLRLTSRALLDQPFLARLARSSAGEAIAVDANLPRVSTGIVIGQREKSIDSRSMHTTIPYPSYIGHVLSSPHAIATRAGHHLANKTMLNTEFGEYLYRSTGHTTLHTGPAIAL